MTQTKIYIKLEQNTEVLKPQVFLKDIAEIVCSDNDVAARVKAIKLHEFAEKEPQKIAISITRIIKLIQKICPNVLVQNVGENDALVERVNPEKGKSAWRVLKIVFVALISFFGTAFTIMAYHNDIAIASIFENVYVMVLGHSGNAAILEVSYSLGLAVGIIVFFNHIGKRRITNDPTPIEVEMRVYEDQVNKALLETASRQGQEEM